MNEVDCLYWKKCKFRKRYKGVQTCPCNMQIKEDGTQVYPEDIPSVFKERRPSEYKTIRASFLEPCRV